MPRKGTLYARRWTVTSWGEFPPDFFGEEVHYAIFGRETCPVTKKEHWQGYVHLKGQLTLASMKEYDDEAHFEVARGGGGDNFAYCSKDGEYIEHNEQYRPTTRKRIDYRQEIEFARTGNFDAMNWGLQFRDKKKIMEHYYDAKCREVMDLPPGTQSGLWIMAESGLGKSHWVRQHFGPIYLKGHNKWWDGYQFQQAVLIDDFDKFTATWAMSFMKLWADRYAYAAEFKGGSFSRIRPRVIIVTSQYHPDTLVPESEPELRDAIKRRFHVAHIHNRSGFDQLLASPWIQNLLTDLHGIQTEVPAQAQSPSSSNTEIGA